MKLLLSDICGCIHTIPDSAIGRDSQPWFLPDFGANWRGYEAVAVRISRLGKNISTKYADRYVDAITTLWVAEADDCSAIDFMDGRVVTGKWHSIDQDTDLTDLFMLLSNASLFATLKNGDIIAKAVSNSAKILHPGMHISNNSLSFNIK